MLPLHHGASQMNILCVRGEKKRSQTPGWHCLLRVATELHWELDASVALKGRPQSHQGYCCAPSLGNTNVGEDLCDCVDSEESCSLSGMRRLLPFCRTSAFPIPGIYLGSSKFFHLWALCKTVMREESLQTSHIRVRVSESCLWLDLHFGVLGDQEESL